MGETFFLSVETVADGVGEGIAGDDVGNGGTSAADLEKTALMKGLMGVLRDTGRVFGVNL